jgi:hypothetical protein
MARLDECFKLIGEKPIKINQRLHDVFIEDFRRDLNEIQGPAARKIFVLANHGKSLPCLGPRRLGAKCGGGDNAGSASRTTAATGETQWTEMVRHTDA